ncbi:hypothetical protein PR202_ga16850 [Eleusine coracana subsp. coracana]|uniref:Mediator of RNA polymerase II transcription subunit 14 n=1 Tax=Eleusine coracana subsp. coracana TaxID=191504 RepID=A0AAV5CMX9_ELECO|nr:hypothetical protein PR202_ga16850 [Eleusine coracana subsp. coracana]
MATELGQQTVELGAVVRRAAEESYLALRELVEKSQAEAEGKGLGGGAYGGRQRSDAEKKIDLLKFIARTRQRMLRLHVLAKWCKQVPLVQYCQQLGSTLSSHETCFTQTADSLYFMHEGLQQAKAPMFDIPSAIEVMLTGGYQRLPRCLEDVGSQNKLSTDEEKHALRKLDASVRYKVLVTPRPKAVSNVSITDGIADFRVDGEFKVLLTLGYRGNVDLWRILHMELLIGEKKGPFKLEESRRFALGDDIERRMAASDKPFNVLYDILHEFCVSLAMDSIIGQANALRQGRWKDAIKSELISDSTFGQTGNAALMQIGQDGEFSSNKEAILSLDLSFINVEQLILRAIACNRHTRLLDIHRQLCKNVQIFQSPKDVVLKRDVDEVKDPHKKEERKGFSDFYGNEMLQVRAYGRRFLLQSPENILPPSALIDCEEALNKGTSAATEVFASLRTRSILHLFAATGSFLGLKVHQQSQGSMKIPKSVLHGYDIMVMGFPHCANMYYLLMQLDKDFRPVFHLLETQCDTSTSDKANASADAKEAIRFNKIDVGRIQIFKNDSSTIPFDVKLQALQGIANCTDIIENGIPIQNGIEALPLLPACSPSFSSIVDEVFEYDEDGPTAKQNQSVPPSGFPSTSRPTSLSVGFHGVDARAVSVSQIHDGGLSHTQGSLNNYLPNNLRHLSSNKTFSYSSPVRNSSATKFLGSKNTHDPGSLCTSSDHNAVDGSKSLHLMPSLHNNSNRIPGQSSYSGSLGNSLPGHLVGLSTARGMAKRISAGSDENFGNSMEEAPQQNGVFGIRIANTSEMDSHISFDADGVVLNYSTVEVDSVQRLVSDLRRLSSARSFAHGMRRLIGVKLDDKIEDNATSMEMKSQSVNKGGAIRPARMPVTVSSGFNSMPKQSTIPMQASIANGSSSSNMHHVPAGPAPSIAPAAHLGSHNLHAAAMRSAAGRGLDLDSFPVHYCLLMFLSCFEDHIGYALYIGLNALEPNFMNAAQASAHLNINAGAPLPAPTANRLSTAPGVAMSRPTSGVANHVAASLSRAGNAMLATSALASGIGGAPVRLTPGTGLPVHMKGELNTAFIGLGDDGGYGGGWVPLAALKKVLRGILKYLGVLWLFAQLPELLKEILGSILKDNEGALLNLDQEQPALRFYVGFHHQQQQQQAQSNAQEELSSAEINEICDYFSRRVASEPYDASRAHGDIATAQRARIELCLENHSGSVSGILFGDNNHVAFLVMDGSHGGRACWLQVEEWERCKQKVARAVGGCEWICGGWRIRPRETANGSGDDPEATPALSTAAKGWPTISWLDCIMTDLLGN